MKEVSTEELIDYKILPYNIYSEFGEKLFAAGEVLTPGKLLQLKHMETIFRDEEFSQPAQTTEEKTEEPMLKQEQEPVEQKQPPKTVIKKTPDPEVFDMKPSTILRNKLSVDDIDIGDYRGHINKEAKIDPQTQLKIKAFYYKILEMLEEKPHSQMLGMFANIRDKIVQDVVFNPSEEIFFSSQVKLLGEYKRCHAINTAILSGILARKMNLSENLIYDIVLAGLLHDIGKDNSQFELLTKSNLTLQEQKNLQEHTKRGYRIIRVEMELPENIAKVALDHHENNDGSGYPSGKSGEIINTETKIVSVCNYFDNLTSNRTPYQIRNTKEALRVILSLGTQKFSADILYTFVHMFSYNDTINFEEMVL